jgi:hypothetical protein
MLQSGIIADIMARMHGREMSSMNRYGVSSVARPERCDER